jgi:carbon starvation protein
MYLRRRNVPNWFIVIPALFMLVMPSWAMWHKILEWWSSESYLLFGIGIVLQFLAAWLLIEAALVWRKAKGNYPELNERT